MRIQLLGAPVHDRKPADASTLPPHADVIPLVQSCGSDLACMCSEAIGSGIVSCGKCGIEFLGNDPNLNTYKAQFQASVNCTFLALSARNVS